MLKHTSLYYHGNTSTFTSDMTFLPIGWAHIYKPVVCEQTLFTMAMTHVYPKMQLW